MSGYRQVANYYKHYLQYILSFWPGVGYNILYNCILENEEKTIKISFIVP